MKQFCIFDFGFWIGRFDSIKIFVLALCSFLLALSFPTNAQQVPQVHHVAFLDEGSVSLRAHLWQALRQRLRELGYIEGQNIAFEARGGDGNAERLADVAAELVRSRVSIIVTGGIRAAVAAHKATTTIPIVMASGTDPVGVGLIASLFRPGGNVTGVTTVSAELGGKRLELLLEVVPRLSRVAVLRDPPAGTVELALQETQAAGSDAWAAASNPGSASPQGFRQRFFGDGEGALRRSPRNIDANVIQWTNADRRARSKTPPTGGLSLEGIRRGWWPSVLWD